MNFLQSVGFVEICKLVVLTGTVTICIIRASKRGSGDINHLESASVNSSNDDYSHNLPGITGRNNDRFNVS